MQKINFFSFLNHLFAWPFIGLIKIYQRTFSPDKGLPSFWLKGKVCSHEPHCSEYSIEVLKRYGLFPGLIYVMDRVVSCVPSMKKKVDPPFYKVVFFSGSPVGIPFLEELAHDRRFELVGVVSMPPKAVGRGLHVQENVVAQKAKELFLQSGKNNLEHNIQTPSKINPNKSDEGKQFFDRLQSLQADFFVVIAYGKILPIEILQLPSIGPVNVHGSLLPKYRGASPIQAALLNGDSETGLTMMLMDAGMDTGPMLRKYSFSLPRERTSKEVFDAMMTHGPKQLTETLIDYAKGHLQPEPQDPSQVTECGKISKEEGEIHFFSTPLSQVYKKYKAFFQRPKIFFILPDQHGKDKHFIIEKLTVDPKLFSELHQKPLFESGLHPAVLDIQIKPEGKKAMGRKEFENGYRPHR